MQKCKSNNKKVSWQVRADRIAMMKLMEILSMKEQVWLFLVYLYFIFQVQGIQSQMLNEDQDS